MIEPATLMQLRGRVLAKSDALQKLAAPAMPTPATDFGTLLADVNALQQQAGALSEGYERGTETDIAKVMLARQKAGIAFEATLQVRNKLIGAYRDIMNMPA